MPKIRYLIPARAGSERFPGKNRVLLPYLWKALPKVVQCTTIISTDDPALLQEAPSISMKLQRPSALATAGASMKDVIAHAAEWAHLDACDRIVTLYPTYIDRTWSEIKRIQAWALEHDYPNVLCSEPLNGISVYKCFHQKSGCFGTPVIQHDLYRGQDYPVCFEASCFVVVTRVDQIEKLNNLLWSEETAFYQLDRRRPDIDTLGDFRRWAECE